MTGFNQIERSRRSRGCSQRTFLCSRPEQKGFSPPGAIYIRISTSQQQTDRQETELKEFALRNGLNFNEKTDMYIDIISGFKEGEARPQYSILKNKVEAEVVRRIFDLFIDGKSSYDIATINRLARNAIYVGQRSSIFHEPDPANPLPAYKRNNRRVYLELNVEQPELRIIDDEKFHQVGKIIDERMFNKNGGIRHDNLLKHLLRCGECGSRFTSAMCKYGRSYKCTGKMPTNRRPRICFLGANVLMYKLDGLVIQLCIRKFTGYDLRRKAMGKIVELEGEIESKRALQQSYRDIAQGLHENYSAVMKRIIKFAKDDAEAENWIAAERSEYERKCEENNKVIDTLKNEIAGLNRRRTSLLKVEDKPEFADR